MGMKGLSKISTPWLLSETTTPPKEDRSLQRGEKKKKHNEKSPVSVAKGNEKKQSVETPWEKWSVGLEDFARSDHAWIGNMKNNREKEKDQNEMKTNLKYLQDIRKSIVKISHFKGCVFLKEQRKQQHGLSSSSVF